MVGVALPEELEIWPEVKERLGKFKEMIDYAKRRSDEFVAEVKQEAKKRKETPTT